MPKIQGFFKTDCPKMYLHHQSWQMNVSTIKSAYISLFSHFFLYKMMTNSHVNLSLLHLLRSILYVTDQPNTSESIRSALRYHYVDLQSTELIRNVEPQSCIRPSVLMRMNFIGTLVKLKLQISFSLKLKTHLYLTLMLRAASAVWIRIRQR